MSKSENNKVGNLIRQIRLSRRMSQMALAEKLDLTYQQVQKYEYGISELTVTRLRQIANALGVSVNVFIEQGEGIADNTAQEIFGEEIKLLKQFRNIKNEQLRGELFGCSEGF